ncbi:MAG: SGNH/GDSL hydrolase family protein [Planctomycetota bacterium]
MLGAVALAVGLAEIAARQLGEPRNVGPAFTVYDPVYLRRLKPDVSFVSTSSEFSWRFTTNTRGLRDPERRVPPQRPILFLGDSFTMGYGVDDGGEFPRLVEAALRRERGPAPPIEVVNAGIGNAGNGHWLKFLAREAPRYQPRLVVLQVSSNDVGDNLRERLFALGDAARLVELPVPGPSWQRRAQSVAESIPGLSHSYLFASLKQWALGRGATPTPTPTPTPPTADAPPGPGGTSAAGEALTLAMIDAALARCAAAGWRTLLLNVGWDGPLRDRLESLCRAHQTPVWTVPTKAERPDLYYVIDGHWRAAGHRWVAEQLEPLIRAALTAPAGQRGP